MRLADDMTDQSPSRQPQQNLVFIPVGLLFIVLGTVFLFTDDMAVVGWTFIPAGVVFLAIGIPTRRSAAAPSRSRRDGGDVAPIASDTRSSDSRETESGGHPDGPAPEHGGFGSGFDGGGSGGDGGGGGGGD